MKNLSQLKKKKKKNKHHPLYKIVDPTDCQWNDNRITQMPRVVPSKTLKNPRVSTRVINL